MRLLIQLPILEKVENNHTERNKTRTAHWHRCAYSSSFGERRTQQKQSHSLQSFHIAKIFTIAKMAGMLIQSLKDEHTATVCIEMIWETLAIYLLQCHLPPPLSLSLSLSFSLSLSLFFSLSLSLSLTLSLSLSLVTRVSQKICKIFVT